VRPYADLIADSDPIFDDIALGLVRDHYLTEYVNPSSPERAAHVADLSRFRGMGPRDILARALLLAGYTYPAVDLQTDAPLPQVVALGSPSFLGAQVQRRLADHVLGGGSLLLSGVLPDRDRDGSPCTILADALGVRGGRFVPASPDYFTSVSGPGLLEVRVGYAQLLSADADPLLVEVGSGEPCGYRLTAGAGRAVVLAADYPCHLDFWRDQVSWLGASPRLRVESDTPGVIAVSTADPRGVRLLHVVNVAPTDASVVVDGLRLRVDARAGLILPANLPVGDAVLISTTCELLRLDGSSVVLRPTQTQDVVDFDTDRITADRGSVDGGRVTLTGPEPVRISVR
jgi:beta-galactosidase